MPVRSIGKVKDVITARSYSKLGEFLQAFAAGHLNLLILIGNPGLAKTRLVKDSLGSTESCWIEGNATAFGIYQQLYQHRDCQFVIIDEEYINQVVSPIVFGLTYSKE